MNHSLSIADRLDRNIFLSKILSYLIWIIRSFNKKFRVNKNQKSTLIISFHRLGDSIFTLPAIKVIQQNSKKIYILCFTESLPIYRNQLNDVVTIGFDKKLDFIAGKIPRSYVRKKLKEINPEIIIDLTASIQSASLIFFSSSKTIVGANNFIYHHLYDYYCFKRTTPHLMDLYLDIVKLKYQVENEIELKTFHIKSESPNLILIHPTAGWKAKEWGISNFLKLTEKLNQLYKCCLIFPPDFLQPEIESYLSEKKLQYIIPEETTKLLEILKRGNLFIGNDSGPAHIASMLGLKTFILFGPTNPLFHIPYGRFHSYYNKSIKCSPKSEEKMCFTNGGISGCPSFECMKVIEVQEVYDSVLKLIQIDNIQIK